MHQQQRCLSHCVTSQWCNNSNHFITTVMACSKMTLHWRHNDHGGVSNHQPYHWLLNRLFRPRSKKTSKLRVIGLCAGNSPGPVNSPHKWPVTRKMFPFDDVIMKSTTSGKDWMPIYLWGRYKGYHGYFYPIGTVCNFEILASQANSLLDIYFSGFIQKNNKVINFRWTGHYSAVITLSTLSQILKIDTQ